MGKMGTFLVGGLIGAAAALLVAPRTGAETRVLVNDKINEVLGGSSGISASVSNVASKVTGAPAADKAAIQLDDLEGQLQQAVEIGVPRAEIVQ